MLAVGRLTYSEIAREAGVSLNLVRSIASGKYKPSSYTLGYFVFEGERYLPEPIRCSGCRQLVSILPCRVCRVRREISEKSRRTPQMK